MISIIYLRGKPPIRIWVRFWDLDSILDTPGLIFGTREVTFWWSCVPGTGFWDLCAPVATHGGTQGEIGKKVRALGAHLDLNGSRVFAFFVHFWASHARFLRSPIVLQFPVPPERCMGWPHMHSVHAGSVQTPFSISALLLKNAFQKTWFWLRFSVTWASGSTKKQ